MKQSYEMPQVEVIEFELEGMIAESNIFGMDNSPELPVLETN